MMVHTQKTLLIAMPLDLQSSLSSTVTFQCQFSGLCLTSYHMELSYRLRLRLTTPLDGELYQTQTLQASQYRLSLLQ
jgi:hypothetical protein